MTIKEKYEYIVQYLNKNDDCGDGFNLDNGQMFIDLMWYTDIEKNSNASYLWTYIEKKKNGIASLFQIHGINNIWIKTAIGDHKLDEDHCYSIITEVYNLIMKLDIECKQWAQQFHNASKEQKLQMYRNKFNVEANKQ